MGALDARGRLLRRGRPVQSTVSHCKLWAKLCNARKCWFCGRLWRLAKKS